MLYRKFKETVRKNSLIEEGDRILVAFSGGPDSTVLLHLLYLFTEEMDYSLAVAHFNHGLREEADEEEEFCRKRAWEYDLPFFSSKEDVKKYAKERGLNIEEAARELRYKFLEEIAQREGFNKIATGHTLSDQAETLLYRLLRGSGLSGLSGIAMIKDGKFVRPLLEISRSEILSFLEKTSIPYLQDPSNLQLSYDRNWLRHRIIPMLMERFPKTEKILAREANILLHEDLWVETIVKSELKKRLKGRKLIAADWEKIPLGFKRRIIRAFLREVRGNLRRINFDHIEHIVNLKPGDQYFLPAEERILRQGKSFVYLGKLPEMKDFSVEIPSQGEYEINNLWKIRISYYEGEADFSRRDRAYISGISFPLKVRNWRPGDKYIPVGSKRKRKISNMYNSLGIPGPFRHFLPIFTKDEDIVWPYLLPCNDKYKFHGKGFLIEVKGFLSAQEF